MKKRALSIALAIMMLIALLPSTVVAATANVWDGTVAKSYAGGTGTSGNPYQIATGAQLAYLATMVNSGINYQGKYFALAADIDLNNVEWTPIGVTTSKDNFSQERAFSGVFDGRNHTIYKLKCNNPNNTNCSGLFGILMCDMDYSNGMIKNLNLSQISVTGYGKNTGSICGILAYGKLQNCSSDGSVIGVDRCGGVVGIADNASIIECESFGVVSGNDDSAVGGIVGVIQCVDVNNCVNYAKVSGNYLVGGIAGIIYESCITKNSNYGQIVGTSNAKTGGICGFLTGCCHATLCYNAGSVSGGASTGGIAGAGDGCLISDCYNTANISQSYETGNAGGIFGEFSRYDGYENPIKNCYNSGIVSGGTYGSFIGKNGAKSGDISNCYYLSGTGSAVGSGKTTGITAKTSAQLSSSAMVTLLGSDVWTRADGVNNGYPVLYYTSLWAQPEIVEADDSGLVPSTLIGTDLTRSITRGEFAAVAVALYEANDGKPITNAQNPFTDISGNTNYNAIIKAYSIGITNGTTSATFEPNVSINREQLATMLCRAIKAAAWSDWTLATDANFQLDSSGATPFADDSKISAFARPSVYYLVKKSVINGIGNNLFAPRNTTDAEAADGYANASREQALVTSLRAYKNT